MDSVDDSIAEDCVLELFCAVQGVAYEVKPVPLMEVVTIQRAVDPAVYCDVVSDIDGSIVEPLVIAEQGVGYVVKPVLPLAVTAQSGGDFVIDVDV